MSKLYAVLQTSPADSIKFVTLVNIAQQHYFKKEYDSVIQLVKRATALGDFIEPKASIRAYTYAGISHNYLGSFDKSVQAHLNALKISEKYGENPARIYNNIGMTYINMKNWMSAENYLNKALKICKEEGIKRGLSYIYGNLGIVYRNQEDYDKALETYNQSLQINLELKDEEATARNYNNLGDLYRHKGDTKNALEYFEKGLQASTAINYQHSIASISVSLGRLLTDLKQYEKALNAFEKGLVIANELKELRILRDGYLGLSELEEKKGQFQKSIRSRKRYEQFQDSLINEDHINEVRKLEIIYETEKKDRAIAEQHLQLQQQDNELQKKQTQYSIMSGIAMILLISSLMGWFLYQQRQKRKNQEILTLKKEQQVKTLESLMEGEEKERFRIAKELHDGVNGDLSAIKYKLSSMLGHNTSIVDEVVAMIDRSSEQVRAISHNLVPPSLEKFNLIEALADYCSTMNEVHEPKINFQHLGGHPQISKNNEINIYRIVQELVSNSVKHAEAKQITVQVSHRDNQIQITVEDSGKGFDPKKINSKGIGLKNLESRIDYLNATKDLVSNTKGTSYTLEIEIDKLNDN